VAGRERDLERLLTFVDAVVAIAVTLLVLPLAEAGAEANDTPVAEVLAAHAIDLLGFVVIARLWVAQHRIVSVLERQTTGLIYLLLTWSLTIVFLPFATSLVTESTGDGLAKIIYIGTMAVSSLLLAVIARVIARDRGLRDTDEAPDAVHASATFVTFLLALALSLAFPVLSYWPLLLLVLTDPVVEGVRRARAWASA
jgi:TMEM175 potassium channel family protein